MRRLFRSSAYLKHKLLQCKWGDKFSSVIRIYFANLIYIEINEIANTTSIWLEIQIRVEDLSTLAHFESHVSASFLTHYTDNLTHFTCVFSLLLNFDVKKCDEWLFWHSHSDEALLPRFFPAWKQTPQLASIPPQLGWFAQQPGLNRLVQNDALKSKCIRCSPGCF